MSGTWYKLKKFLSFRNSGSPASSQDPPRVSSQSESRSELLRYPSTVTSSSSSSLSSRLSRSISSNVRSSKKTCAICLGNLRSGQGHAIFTAECSHSFHFSCIANNVKHGNHICPICRFKWKEIPLQLSNSGANANYNIGARAQASPYQARFEDYSFRSPTPRITEPLLFSDDEPIVATELTSQTSSVPLNNVMIKSFAEFPAISASESVSEFAVLVGIRAPPLLDDARQSDRAPIDLVTVLDVSGSMIGEKLDLLKHAVCFVIDNLGPADRLSIVSFSSNSHRILPLCRMTDRGRQDAKLAVRALYADGGTNIVDGLKKGARVLEERREKNPVASLILLSDGKDTYNSSNMANSRRRQNRIGLGYLNLLPRSICRRDTEIMDGIQMSTFPVHTFGFGADHDSFAMHAISDASGGTFSFIESIGIVQDAFARCIGGLLSIVCQELRLTVSSGSSGVKIFLIPSGRYSSEISEQGLHGFINVGDIYADEEKEFLIYLSIPTCSTSEGEEDVERTSLLRISCSYKDTVSKSMVQLEGENVEIRRPMILSTTDAQVSLEVDRERNRLLVAKNIAEAQEMAETGNLEGAQALLTETRSTLISSASAQAGDALCRLLEAELMEIRERMGNMEMYEHTGRAYMLSGLSSHSWQRATTRGDSTTQVLVRESVSSHSGSVGYRTPSMVNMVSKSQNLALNSKEEVPWNSKSANLTT